MAEYLYSWVKGFEEFLVKPLNEKSKVSDEKTKIHKNKTKLLPFLLRTGLKYKIR